MARAKRIAYLKREFPDGSILEIRVWRLPDATKERPHGLKYSLFYGRPGERWVCYDNERGKGDHKHIGKVEVPYEFVDERKLLLDFRADVERLRRRQ